MSFHMFDVAETFDISGRGLVIATNKTFATLGDVVVRIGDPITIRRDSADDLATSVVGIEHCDPWSPERIFAFLVPQGISKSDVPIGSQIWSVDT
ncbi:MAG: hypothetical protein ACF8AM_11575 [Rhodopirellula sp. JB055]|uniref:hypothetical protein n=1 Tax=Rhodopirellula sp. JB055 TaxID=3342846 RepID=UPI00370A42CD